ncbi:hypothetical protein BH23CHL2_BH23CHL2_12170 [soil metagenome]
MQARLFQLTGYSEAASRLTTRENARLSDLRSVIREAIARGITLVLDQERFLYRVTEVIAESSGYPIVIAYVAEPDGERMALGAATQTAPDWVPKRLPASVFQSQTPVVVATKQVFSQIEWFEDTSTVVIPLISANTLQGVLLILHVSGSDISKDDLEAFAVGGEEIAPAVLVANTHRIVRDSVIFDLETGAYTYSYFVERLDQELSRAQRSGNSVTIVLVEAPNFAEFEAAAGYDLADQILKDLASGFSDLMRTSDVVARRGRTGFALMLPESNIEGGGVTIRRIEERLAQVDSELEDLGFSGPKPGIIAGAATFPADGQDSAALVLAADQRMLADATLPDSE